MTTDATKPATEAQQTLWNERRSLEVRTAAGQVDVRVNGLTLWRFRLDDTGSRNVAIVGLLEGDLFKAKEIAAAFGMKEPRISQIRKRYRDGGAALLLSTSPRVTGPRRLTAAEIDVARRWLREGMSVEEITAKACATWRKVDEDTIRRYLGRRRPVTPLLPLGDEGEATTGTTGPRDVQQSESDGEALKAKPEAGTEVPESGSKPSESEAPPPAPEVAVRANAVEAPRECTVAGAMVAHVALEKLGFRAALAASGARVGPSHTFDLLRTAAVLVFGVLLRYRTVEALRDLIRADFGALLGIPRAPEVRTVRRKLEQISEPGAGFDGLAFLRELARGVVASAPAPEGVYFFDDHFKAYHGKRPLAKGWDAKRRIGAPGIEDVYVHDLKGRAVLFVPLDAPTALSCAVPKALAELRKIDATRPTLAVFDRGGFSRDLFRSLVQPTNGEERIDFLTYLKERKKLRQLPASSFRKVSCEEDGRTAEFEVAESTLEFKDLTQPLRLIVLLDAKKAKQIPIITSDGTTSAAKLVYLLRARWRQENSFKYLVGELGIDALVSRDMIVANDTRTIENPERIAQRAQIAEAKAELAAVDAKIAAALASNEESRRPTVRGFKIANAELTTERDLLLGMIEAMTVDLAAMPARVPRSDLDPTVQLATPRTARRVFVNGTKLFVYNAEKWLVERMGDGPYRSHALVILRALCNQPGTIRVGPDRVVVEVRPLDTPRYQRCVEHLFAALNAEGASLLDSGLPIEFRVAPIRDDPNDGKMS